MKNMKKITIPVGKRRCFVGNVAIHKPQNHGWTLEIFNTLLEQSEFTIKEWNGKQWIDLQSKDLRLLAKRS